MRVAIIVAAVLVVLCSVVPTWADQEQRAIELGSAAKCSQTWNAASIVADGDNSYGWHPSVTPDKPCYYEGTIAWLTFHSAPGEPTAGTAGTHADVFAALPASHTNTYVLVMPDGYTGQTEGGYVNEAQIQTQGRWAFRWYTYYSSDYASYSYPAGPCTNSSKWATIQPSYLQMSHQANLTTPQIYGWAVPPDALAWVPDVSECCYAGPGYDSAASADGALPGSWWRFEIVAHGLDGTAGAYIKVYRKNVTIDGPERTIIDTTIDCVDCGDNGFDWPADAKTALQSPAGMTFVTNNFYRAGTCAGYIATAYALFAQWDTDSGQRIGAAEEIEGTGSDTTPPAVPTGVYVTQRHEE